MRVLEIIINLEFRNFAWRPGMTDENRNQELTALPHADLGARVPELEGFNNRTAPCRPRTMSERPMTSGLSGQPAGRTGLMTAAAHGAATGSVLRAHGEPEHESLCEQMLSQAETHNHASKANGSLMFYLETMAECCL